MTEARKHVRILLVEDNSADAQRVAEQLSAIPSIGIELRTVGLSPEALDPREPVDVILLDLPQLDPERLEALERMLSGGHSVPVVVLTGVADEEGACRAMHLGAQDCLVKSDTTPVLLLRAILYAIERKRAQDNAKVAEVARRTRLLAEISAVLASAHELDVIAQRFARALIPALGDCAVLDLLNGTEQLQRVAACASSPEIEHALSQKRVSHVREDEGSLAWQAVRSRRSMWIGDSARESSSCEGGAGVSGRSVLAVPLVLREEAFGVLTLMFRQGGRTHGREEHALAQELARRAALAFENARLYQTVQRAVKARQEVLSVVSHDLRSPLNVMGLVLHMLKQLRPGEPAPKDLVARAERAHSRMVGILDMLLDISRIEQGTLQLDCQPVDCAALLGELLEQQKPLAHEKKLALELDLKQADVKALLDRARIAQVISILVGNAIQLTAPGGVIRVVAQARDTRLSVAVSDTGPGIDAQQLSHVFDRFWQAGKAVKGGVGLGLAIAKGIVESHGGTISASSDPGRGATFRFELPVTLPVAEEKPLREPLTRARVAP